MRRDPAGRAKRLDAAREVHRFAEHIVEALVGRPQHARRHHARVDADAHAERELCADLALHRQRREHGIGAVGRALERHAEQRHDAVAIGLVDIAAISPDDLARGTEELVELREYLVRLHARAVGREVDHVGEHYRHVEPPRQQLVLQHQRDHFGRRHAAQQGLAQLLLAPDLIERGRELRCARRDTGLQRLVETQQLGVGGIELARALDGIEVHPRVVDAGGDLIADDRQQHLVKFVEGVGCCALDAEHADQPVLDDEGNRQLALRMGKPRHLHRRLKRGLPRGLRAGAHAGEIGPLRRDIAHAHNAPPPRRHAEHALPHGISAPVRRHHSPGSPPP